MWEYPEMSKSKRWLEFVISILSKGKGGGEKGA